MGDSSIERLRYYRIVAPGETSRVFDYAVKLSLQELGQHLWTQLSEVANSDFVAKIDKQTLRARIFYWR